MANQVTPIQPGGIGAAICVQPGVPAAFTQIADGGRWVAILYPGTTQPAVVLAFHNNGRNELMRFDPQGGVIDQTEMAASPDMVGQIQHLASQLESAERRNYGTQAALQLAESRLAAQASQFSESAPPQITVNVPEQPAPIINVTLQMPATETTIRHDAKGEIVGSITRPLDESGVDNLQLLRGAR